MATRTVGGRERDQGSGSRVERATCANRSSRGNCLTSNSATPTGRSVSTATDPDSRGRYGSSNGCRGSPESSVTVECPTVPPPSNTPTATQVAPVGQGEVPIPPTTLALNTAGATGRYRGQGDQQERQSHPGVNIGFHRTAVLHRGFSTSQTTIHERRDSEVYRIPVNADVCRSGRSSACTRHSSAAIRRRDGTTD